MPAPCALALSLAVLPLIAAVAGAVPAGVTIPVALVGAVSSHDVKAGDPFRFKTTAAVTAGDLAIPAGTPGTGTVVAAAPGTHGFKAGNLELQPRALQLTDGRIVHVALAAATAGAVHRKTHAHLFPLPFLVGGVLVVGGIGRPAQDAVLADGTPFSVVTESEPEEPQRAK